MTNIELRKRSGGRWMVAGLAVALATSASGVLRASAQEGPRQLAGAWMVQVTLRDCASNAPMGTFASLVTFHDGGTISEDTASGAFAPGQRTSGHGEWTRTRGGGYQQRMIALITYDTAANLPGTPTFNPGARITPGFYAGWSVVTHSVEVVDADHLVSSGTNAFYTTDGTLYRSGCSTAAATRFE